MEKPYRSLQSHPLIIAGLIMGVCLCILLVVLIGNGTPFGISLGLSTPAVDKATSFMNALQEEDYDRAFSQCSPSLQKRLGNSAGLQQAIEGIAARPKAWKFTQSHAEGANVVISGTLLTNREGKLTIHLSQMESQWQVDAFEFVFK